MSLPEVLVDEAHLDQVLTEPSARLVDFISRVSSPLVLLGAGGKMGPTLAVLAQKAALAAGHKLEVLAVSRFRNPDARAWLESQGIRTLSCDLLDARAVAELPDAGNVIYLVGQKFGTRQAPSLTWAMNTLVPDRVAQRYGGARMVALSTANVYPLSPVAQGGSVETDALTPLGEYPNAAVGRERILEFNAQQQHTPLALLRLSYAVDLRYGVIRDLARSVALGQALDLTTGYFHCIWQGDANEMILRSLSLARSPAEAWNLCHPQVVGVRETAEQLGALLGRKPQFVGTESTTALLANPTRICAELGRPAVSMETLVRWTADWERRGGRYLDKPTHFATRDGQY